MKKNGPTKNLPRSSGKHSFLHIIRAFLSAILILHKGLGVPRIIAAYIFFIFAVLSLLLTVKVPLTSDFLSPTGWAKAQSRAITGFMTIINLVVYGVIMNWRKTGVLRTAIRATLIGSTFYIDLLLIRITYILIRDVTLF
jgi:hypothetical protein